VTVTDTHGVTAPRANNSIHFDIEGPGEIVVTDNGDPTSFESFHSVNRKAFNGLALAIIRSQPGQPGQIKLTASADGLKLGTTSIKTTQEP
jgi:beta-galactosidase